MPVEVLLGMGNLHMAGVCVASTALLSNAWAPCSTRPIAAEGDTMSMKMGLITLGERSGVRARVSNDLLFNVP